VWSDEELEICRELQAERNGPLLTPETVAEIVRIAGRIPRYIFDYPGGKDPIEWNRSEIDRAVRHRELVPILEAAGAIGDGVAITYRIFAVEVTPEYDRAGAQFHN